MRVAAVTGTASGIGRAIAARFMADGWHVIGYDRAPGATGSRTESIDVGDEAQVTAAIASLRKATRSSLNASTMDAYAT